MTQCIAGSNCTYFNSTDLYSDMIDGRYDSVISPSNEPNVWKYMLGEQSDKIVKSTMLVFLGILGLCLAIFGGLCLLHRNRASHNKKNTMV